MKLHRIIYVILLINCTISYLPGQSAVRILENQPTLYPGYRAANYMHNYYLPPPRGSSPWWVSWTANGNHLLFLSNRGIPDGTGAIWKMPAEENGIARAQLVYREETLYRTRPHISPDGTRVVYSSHLGGQYNNLFVLPVDGGAPYKMTFAEWDCFHPRWSPDGEQIAYLSNKEGLPEIHFLDAFGGQDVKLEIKTKIWKVPVGKVRVRIVDPSTGSAIPARIYSTAADGKMYTPAGAMHRVARRLSEHCFHTSGEFELEVPVGKLSVEAMCGFEYYPKRMEINVSENEIQLIEIPLRRMIDLKAHNWYSGSNHVHMNYGGNMHNTPDNLIAMARAEDLGVIVEQVANNDNRILDYQYFTGAVHPSSDDHQVLYFNQEYRPPFYGHISIVNLKDHLISPFVTWYAGTAIESLYPSNTDILRKAKQQGALSAYVHPYRGNSDPRDSNLGGAKAFPVELALGTIDYHELASQANWAAFLVWYHALNCGFEIPIVGGEDAITDLYKTPIIGQYRTYIFMENGLSWDNWINGILSGNTIVTNGGQPIRSAKAAGYFIKWIDKLSEMAAVHPGWRTEQEKAHVLAQFEEAKEVYQMRLEEAIRLNRE